MCKGNLQTRDESIKCSHWSPLDPSATNESQTKVAAEASSATTSFTSAGNYFLLHPQITPAQQWSETMHANTGIKRFLAGPTGLGTGLTTLAQPLDPFPVSIALDFSSLPSIAGVALELEKKNSLGPKWNRFAVDGDHNGKRVPQVLRNVCYPGAYLVDWRCLGLDGGFFVGRSGNPKVNALQLLLPPSHLSTSILPENNTPEKKGEEGSFFF